MSDTECTPPKKKKTKTVSQKFRHEYELKYPVVSRSKISEEHAFCKICETDISIAHGGIDDIKKHVQTGIVLPIFVC